MKRQNQEKSEHEKLDDVILTGYQTAEEYLLERALRYSDENKKKIMESRASRRVRRLRAVDEDQVPSITPPSEEAGQSRNASGISPDLEEPVITLSLSSEEKNDSQSNQTDNPTITKPTRIKQTWRFSPISQPSSPVAPELPPLDTYLLNNIPLMSILSVTEQRPGVPGPNTSSGLVNIRVPSSTASDDSEPLILRDLLECRCSMAINQQNVANGLERSASLRFNYPNERNQLRATYRQENRNLFSVQTTSIETSKTRPHIAALDLNPGAYSQPGFAPTLSQPVPARVDTAYVSSGLNLTNVLNTGQMTQSNFMQLASQTRPPVFDIDEIMTQQNYTQNNIQPLRQGGFFSSGPLGQQNFQHVDPTQNIEMPAPHYFTRRARAALDAARPGYSEGMSNMSMPLPGQQYPPPSLFSAYSGAGAGYPEQSFNPGYRTPAMPPPPLLRCRHCCKTYKTNTGLKNHLRRVCEMNMFDQYHNNMR